jgi:hypothetical protein
MSNQPQILREVEGDNPKPPQVVLTADVKKLIAAGIITEKDARKALSEGRTPQVLLEG